jgi:lipopolysaccharide transport system ATP-binding protein
MNDVLITAEHVSKKFCRSLKRSLWYGVKDMAGALKLSSRSEAATAIADGEGLPPLRTDEFWALQDVSFDVRRGECLGLVGHNGAGKSTLLKILNGLLRPDAGIITMRGRVGALIELNAGFNPILSGRENIYHQASLLGFNIEEIRARFDDIVEFSEIGEFIDMPVQNYSSGMRVRLGFAVAAQMEPDILLIDEVLAVGDVGFRAKCLARMAELLKKSAFIFVSHSMPQVARISTGVMHLHHGKVLALTSELSAGLDSYYGTFASAAQGLSGNGDVRITSISAASGSNAAKLGEQLPVGWGQDVLVRIDCEFLAGRQEATIQLLVWNQELVPVIDVVGPDFKRVPISPDPSGKCVVETRIQGLQFNTGRYSISVIVLSPDGLTTLCQVDQALELRVSSNQGSGSSVVWPGSWRIQDEMESSHLSNNQC